MTETTQTGVTPPPASTVSVQVTAHAAPSSKLAQDMWAAWSRLLATPLEPDALDLGTILAACQHTSLRDALLVASIFEPGVPTPHHRDNPLDCEQTRARNALTAVLGTELGVRPGSAAKRAGTVLKQVACVEEGPRSAAPWSMLAWIRWWAGDWDASKRAALLALERRPEYGLAKLVAACLERGVGPGWYRQQDENGVLSAS